MKELRKQQIRLGLLKAARVLFSCQDKLRQVLLQSLPPDWLPSETEPSDDPLSPDTEAPGSILQQLMVAGTQPSPIKAFFSREELEVIANTLTHLD